MKPDQIVAEVAATYQVTVAAIVGRSRKAAIVEARRAVCHRLRDETDMSYTEIGRKLGGRDHTTIITLTRRPPSPPAPSNDGPARSPEVCTVDGCGRPHVAFGWCTGHYTRWRRHGTPMEHIPLDARGSLNRAPCGTFGGYRRHLKEGTDKCQPCKDANAAQSRRYYRPRRVPSGPALEALDRLFGSGRTQAEIARRAGVSQQTLSYLANTRPDTVFPTTADTICRLDEGCEDCDRPALAGGRWCGVGRCVARTGRWSWSQPVQTRSAA